MKNIRIVLVNTSHPGNIGAAARAMKTMGLERLVLVAPKDFPSEEATARATGASDILEQAIVAPNLRMAIQDCEWVLGTSGRNRYLQRSIVSPRECGQWIADHNDAEIAILFGNERNGLSNEELAFCQSQIVIPTAPQFSSLNLAAAVQIICYEIFSSSLTEISCQPDSLVPSLVKVEQLEQLYDHLQRVMIETHFLNPEQPKQLMPKLKRFFSRAQLEEDELNIFRGFLTAVEKHFK